MRSLCVECSAVLIDMKLTYNIWHFIAGEDSEATKNQLTEQILEESCDKALNKADYNWDGYISWDEYVYSLGDKEVAQHVNEFETHETDHHKRWMHWWFQSIHVYNNIPGIRQSNGHWFLLFHNGRMHPSSTLWIRLTFKENYRSRFFHSELAIRLSHNTQGMISLGNSMSQKNNFTRAYSLWFSKRVVTKTFIYFFPNHSTIFVRISHTLVILIKTHVFPPKSSKFINDRYQKR